MGDALRKLNITVINWIESSLDLTIQTYLVHLIAQECQLSEEHGGCELHQVFAACVSHNTHPRLHNVELVSLISLGTDVQCIVSDAV